MKKLRGSRLGLSEHIPAARWCLALAVTAFAAVVSVRRYIDMADMAAFSSFETMFMIMTDITNIVFIYLPLYLFIVCGIMFDNGFGCTETLRRGSRRRWFAGKLLTCLVNTILFFAAVMLINLAVCTRAFEYSGIWSEGFVSYRVMTGNPAGDFSGAPLPTITGASVSAFLYYLLCGVINIFFSLLTDREPAALFISFFAGIVLGLLSMTALGNDLKSQLVRCVFLLAAAAAVCALSLAAAMKKDLGGKRSLR